MENNRIKRFKDFNESQDPMGSSIKSMQNDGAASGNLNMADPFRSQMARQGNFINKITDTTVKEITKSLGEEENEDEEEEEENED